MKINIINLLYLTLKGGKGSGNFGHAGVPGRRGGSSSNSTGITISDAINKVDELDKEREWGKLPLSELFNKTVPREKASIFNTIAGTATKVSKIPFNSLIATQKTVDTDTIKEILRKGSNYESRGGKYPVVVRSKGKNYLVDGHSRTVAAMLLGKKDLDMLVVETNLVLE